MISPSDQEFRYIGLTEDQIDTLRDQPNDLRWIVYDEGMRLLMECDYRHDSLPAKMSF